ncbi:MAG: leucine--tRNA ligase [Clostridia bacterium]|nr:leucine--tRNA ligase [Clostridia bacterium]
MKKLGYNRSIDEKWQAKWKDTDLYHFDINSDKEKIYLLEMFSYPSASKLHMGHWWNYSLPDTWGRMKRMQGYNVFHPMGFDAFGLPAENYAIKTGIHPKDSTNENIATMEKQLASIGCTYDWSHEIKTCDPSYYKWTQWLFIQLYKHGLAYKKEALVNWCPKCNTVLANEQAAGGICERCKSIVEQRKMSQWFFKITDYAEELLRDHDKLDWPERTKAIQKNWIGRSTGTEVSFNVVDSDEKITVFTTRVDTLMGLSYVVLAPESELALKLTTPEQKEVVEAYIKEAMKKNEIERSSTSAEYEKTGVFTGSYAIHPLTGKTVQIWISDYVIASYGTGAVMAVPAHDERDFEFATKFGLPISRVITAGEGDETLPYCEKGVLINSGKYDGMSFAEAKKAMTEDLAAMGMGCEKVTYRLRDWSVSRQRYWGCPIPVIYCDDCGVVTVPEEQLPVELPYDVEFMPTGESPLKSCESYVNTVCPCCGRKAKRETDTLDTFVCSSWYQLRYPENTRDDVPFGEDTVNKFMPVDKYVGGIEHAAMHLIYCRFIYKALRDMGYVKGDEPYPSLIHQGVIFGPDGARMSKSRGNTVAPDEYVSKYGSDVFRTYLAFGFDYSAGGAWKDSGIEAISSFFRRFTGIVESFTECGDDGAKLVTDADTERVMHKTIKAVTNDVDAFHFNTAIARLMEFSNAISKYQSGNNRNSAFERTLVENFIKLIGIFAPHYGEELWETIGNEYSLFNQSWPVFDESKIALDEFEVAVQICGKIKDRMMVSASSTEDEIKQAALALDKIKDAVGDKPVKKVIVIKNRLVNIVV